LALVEVSVVEQRYRAVLEVRAGMPVTEVAARAGVSRQSVHAWVRRYEQGGLGALADRSRRPESCPHQVSAEVEARVCELRREHPKWGPLRLAHELAKAGVVPAPSRMSAYRVLVRHGLVEPGPRKRPKDSYLRWERDEPMALWQLDIVGGAFLADGTEAKVVTGVDDHSRYCVIASWRPGPPEGPSAWRSLPRCAPSGCPAKCSPTMASSSPTGSARAARCCSTGSAGTTGSPTG
jgi:transposase